MVRKSEIDDVDKKILEILLSNSRLSYVEIGKLLGLSEGTIRKRIKKLIERKIIIGFTAIIDYKKIGKIESLTGINVLPERLLKVIENLKNIKNIKRIYLTSGDHNLIADIVCDTFDDLNKIHKEIENMEGVQNVYPATIIEILM